jgi:hypothetical protein
MVSMGVTLGVWELRVGLYVFLEALNARVSRE